MVECESTFLLISLILYRGFNRYMVECESILTAQQLSEILVLIDTWWNVNQLAEGGVLKKGQVLIDTWWNVNTDSICKWFGIQPVLIDTWWNVNLQ